MLEQGIMGMIPTVRLQWVNVKVGLYIMTGNHGNDSDRQTVIG